MDNVALDDCPHHHPAILSSRHCMSTQLCCWIWGLFDIVMRQQSNAQLTNNRTDDSRVIRLTCGTLPDAAGHDQTQWGIWSG